ncbi:MAG: CO dehydrogenase/CO-methylating acetyl-CoA synthase complex subunit beta [Candidatus Heimdallarchaeota archaeon]
MALDIDLKSLPIDVGLVYEGERIRAKDMHVELGGPRVATKWELVQVVPKDKIEHGRIQVIGPDIPEMEVGSTHPIGVLVKIAGDRVEKDLEAVFERRIHEYTNQAQGVMHLNQRYDIHLRVAKKSVEKGFNFDVMGKIYLKFYQDDLGVFEKMQITFITDPDKVAEMEAEAKESYEARDARARTMTDDEADSFYGCVLCQSFAPTHVCLISPERIGSCGAINWFDARAAARMDPEGPNFEISKGETINPDTGEYSGVNDAIQERSLGEIDRVEFHRLFGKNMTSCGCFEACAFAIPEMGEKAFGVVDRSYKGETVIGLPYSTMATEVGGGCQTMGFVGMAVEYLRSKRFLKVDGGYSGLVWLPQALKERVKDGIPEDMYDKIATEADVSNLDELKDYLKERNHPLIETWAEEEAAPAEAPAVSTAAPGQLQMAMPGPMQIGQLPQMTLPATSGGPGIRLELHNVRIYADKVIVKKINPKK